MLVRQRSDSLDTTMHQETMSDGTIQFEWPGGYAQVKRLAPGVLFFRKVGFFPASTYRSLVRPFQQELKAEQKLVMVCDCGDMTNYETAYRLSWTDWFKAGKGRVQAHLFTRSKFVRMAISVVNLVTHVFTTHESHAELEDALRRHVPSFSPAMLPQPRKAPADIRSA